MRNEWCKWDSDRLIPALFFIILMGWGSFVIGSLVLPDAPFLLMVTVASVSAVLFIAIRLSHLRREHLGPKPQEQDAPTTETPEQKRER